MKKYISIFISMAFALASCSKSFLTENPESSVSTSTAIRTTTDMTAAVNGMYAALREPAGANLYGRTLPIIGDLMGDNIYISAVNSGRYLTQQNFSMTVTDGFVSGTFGAAYAAILRANNIINAKIDSNATVASLKGEAHAVRALMYFELVREFAKPFTVDPSAPGVPIVLTYDPNAKPARSSVSTVYAQIVSDLQKAVADINSDKSSAYFNKYAAEALLARVYQFMADWPHAQQAAEDIVQNGGYTLAPSGKFAAYWANTKPTTDKVETLFEVEFDRVDYEGTEGLNYFYSPDGYGDALATRGLYDSYSATDERKALIYEDDNGDLRVNKYPNTNNRDGTDNTKVIRYAEVLLILAEAYHNNGDDAKAQETLNEVAEQRDPSFTGYTDTGAALLDDILNERRKELAFEGFRYWDFVRLNLPVQRDTDPSEYSPQTPRLIAADDPHRQMPIPQVELDANPNVTQNPGY